MYNMHFLAYLEKKTKLKLSNIDLNVYLKKKM